MRRRLPEGSIDSRIVVGGRIRRGFLRVRGRISNRFQGRIGKRIRCPVGGRCGSGGRRPGSAPRPNPPHKRGPPPPPTPPEDEEGNKPFARVQPPNDGDEVGVGWAPLWGVNR